MSALAGKVALVTGAGSGIGAATVRELVAQGARVGALDRDAAAAQAVADEAARGGHDAGADTALGRHKTAADTAVGGHDAGADTALGRHKTAADTAVGRDEAGTDTAALGRGAAGEDAAAFGCDVRDDDAVRAAVTGVAERFGGLDIAVNCAGVVRYGRVDELSDEDWDLQIDTNLRGVFLVARHAIPLLRERGGGAIVNVASTQAFASQELVAAYAASKGAVVAMTRTMALDHARDGIRVNAVGPGSVDTAMLRWAAGVFSPEDPDAAIGEWGASHPIGRVIAPDEVARVIAFLAGDAASAVTGATYMVDGGATAKLST